MGREPFRDLMNHVVAFNSLFQEIEEKAKKLEQEKERLSYIEGIFYNSGAAIIITDREGKIKFFSRGAESLTEYKRDEAEDKNIALLLSGKLNFGEFIHESGGKQHISMESMARSWCRYFHLKLMAAHLYFSCPWKKMLI